MHLIDGIYNSARSNGGASNGVDIFKRKRRNHSYELQTERILKSLGTKAFRLIEECIADGDVGDSARIVHLESNGYRAGKALNACGIGRSSAAAHIHHELTGKVYAAVNSSRSDGGTRNCVDSIVALFSRTLNKLERHGFTGKLIGKGRFLCKRAQTGRFAEVFTADVNAGDGIVAVHADSYDDFAAITFDSGFNHIANGIAIGVKAFIAAVHTAAFFNLYSFETDGRGKKTCTGFSSSLKGVFLNGTLGDQVENSQQSSCNQTDCYQRYQIAESFFVHYRNPPLFSARALALVNTCQHPSERQHAMCCKNILFIISRMYK